MSCKCLPNGLHSWEAPTTAFLLFYCNKKARTNSIVAASSICLQCDHGWIIAKRRRERALDESSASAQYRCYQVSLNWPCCSPEILLLFWGTLGNEVTLESLNWIKVSLESNCCCFFVFLSYYGNKDKSDSVPSADAVVVVAAATAATIKLPFYWALCPN